MEATDELRGGAGFNRLRFLSKALCKRAVVAVPGF